MGDLLVVGLGNPGARYSRTRHNVGADAVGELATRASDHLRADTKVSAQTATVRLGGSRVVLAVPLTYMNDSGRALFQLLRRHKPEELADVVIIHDELDLDPGVVRVKSGGGLAGHNGLRSIVEHLGSNDFTRVRIGVGKPPGGSARGVDWVLSRVSGEARTLLDESVIRAADAVEAIVASGVDGAMGEFNARR